MADYIKYRVSYRNILCRMRIFVSDPNDVVKYSRQVDADTFILDFDKIVDTMFPNAHPSTRQIALHYIQRAAMKFVMRDNRRSINQHVLFGDKMAIRREILTQHLHGGNGIDE